MTKQTWTAAVSALLFVIAAAVVALTPVPFVTYSPGVSHDLLASSDAGPVIAVEGLETFEGQGELLLTTVSVTRPDAPVSLPEVLYAYWAPDREVYPRDFVYAIRSTAEEIRTREAQQMTASQADAAAAALRAAGIHVDQIPMVQSVASAGPAVDKLYPGDFIIEVDGEPMSTVAQVREAIEKRGIGQSVVFTIERDRERLAVTIDTAASKTQSGVPVWGGNLVMGYNYAPRVTFSLDSSLGGSSGGLMMALAIFDRITPGSLVGERVVAGTGTIDGSGAVDRVDGIREKLAAAERDGAEVFFVPDDNCSDLAGVDTDVRLVSVSTLENAINSLDMLADAATEGLVKGCS